MNQAFLLKYGEIALKGKNRHTFEEALVRSVENALSAVDGEFIVTSPQGRIFVEAKTKVYEDEVIEALSKVFGLIAICPAVLTEDEGFDKLADEVVRFIDESFEKKDFSFKVDSRRARKDYPLNSMELNAALGERILSAFSDTRVDVHEPEVLIRVEIRERINFYVREIAGPGGMPVGTNGRAELLLSGGIDSPVAGYMTAKRGVSIDAVYFHAPPYTGERAKQKVIDLARIVSEYAGKMKLHVVNFTDIQLYIYEKCPHEELTIIMRRYMMLIAERFAKADGALGLVTGESVGQVASQTMHSLAVTNAVCTMPVLRPLIGFDKQEIIDRAVKIGTYDTSILPYEDCCTIFVAKHPVTKPVLARIEKSEEKLKDKIDELVEEAVNSCETIEIGA